MSQAKPMAFNLLKKQFKIKVLRCRKGLSTITSVFMLLLMFAALTGIVGVSFSYNYSIQQQMSIEKERSQEQIAITKIGANNGRITSITIANTGQIEVKIRALYREQDEATTFLIDPSIYILPNNHTTLNISSIGLTFDPYATFVAATERGVRSKGVIERLFIYDETPTNLDTSSLSIGPLMLTFDSLNWARVDANGNVQGEWLQTWTIPTGLCSWRLNLTNIDPQNRSLVINKYSGFTASLVQSPTTTTWYLKEIQQVAAWNTTLTITFLWDESRTKTVSASPNSKGVNNVFLTLFGYFSDGETYAQTIPFEAITIA